MSICVHIYRLTINGTPYTNRQLYTTVWIQNKYTLLIVSVISVWNFFKHWSQTYIPSFFNLLRVQHERICLFPTRPIVSGSIIRVIKKCAAWKHTHLKHRSSCFLFSQMYSIDLLLPVEYFVNFGTGTFRCNVCYRNKTFHFVARQVALPAR